MKKILLALTLALASTAAFAYEDSSDGFWNEISDRTAAEIREEIRECRQACLDDAEAPGWEIRACLAQCEKIKK